MHAEHAERAELLRELAGRQRAVLEPLADVRTKPVGGERAHRVAQQPIVVVEVVVEIEQIEPVERVGHGGEATPHVSRPRLRARAWGTLSISTRSTVPA